MVSLGDRVCQHGVWDIQSQPGMAKHGGEPVEEGGTEGWSVMVERVRTDVVGEAVGGGRGEICQLLGMLLKAWSPDQQHQPPWSLLSSAESHAESLNS